MLTCSGETYIQLSIHLCINRNFLSCKSFLVERSDILYSAKFLSAVIFANLPKIYFVDLIFAVRHLVP